MKEISNIYWKLNKMTITGKGSSRHKIFTKLEYYL
jgi:hypothetical protein